MRANKGEWSELYAFIKLLKDGRIYAADENVNRIENNYFPILRLIREETMGERFDYRRGDMIRIYKNESFIKEIDPASLCETADLLYEKIFQGVAGQTGAFDIPEMNSVMNDLHIEKVKAPSREKVDITMQLHDIQTHYERIVGFSVKSDIGSPPTLLNAAKNTRIKYRINGITKVQMQAINSIDGSVNKTYMVQRIGTLFNLAESIEFYSVKDSTFEGNLMLIDSLMPRIYGEYVLYHYRHIAESIYDLRRISDAVGNLNPMQYLNLNTYKFKIKKLLCASALGMTPGKIWDGRDSANGGYIIIKRDGDILCYHIYNRDFFEEYLINNTSFDRPSATKHDYGHVYEENGEFFIDLNVQIRFKKISG